MTNHIQTLKTLQWRCPYCEDIVNAPIEGIVDVADIHLRQYHDTSVSEYREDWPNV